MSALEARLVPFLALCWLSAVLALIVSRAPYIDEGYYTLPSYNHALYGTWDARQIEPSGFVHPSNDRPLTGINRRAYWIMPLHIFIQSAWYAVVGWGLIQQRLLSALFGGIGLVVWYDVVRRIGGNSRVAFWAAVLIAFDWTYLSAASTGRMDMMSHVLGMLAVHAHLWRHLTTPALARTLSGFFLCASLMVHPNGFAVWAAVYAAVSIMSWRTWKLSHLPALIAPFLVTAVLYGWWASADLAAFREQLSVNSAFRLTSFSFNEARRYLDCYGIGWDKLLKGESLKAFPLMTLGCCALLWLRRVGRGGSYGLRTCLVLATVAVSALAVADGTKWPVYALHTVPWLAVASALMFNGFESETLRRFSAAWLVLYVLFPLLAAASIAYRNPYRRLYLEAVGALTDARVTRTLVFAPPEFVFKYQNPMLYDVRLGFRSGRAVSAVAVDKANHQDVMDWARLHNRQLYGHIEDLLQRRCALRFENGRYAVYGCAVALSGSGMAPAR